MHLLISSIIFPLQGELANLCIGFESIIIFLFFILFVIFLRRYFYSSKNKREARNFSWSLIFLGWGLAYFIFLFCDYIIEDPIVRDDYSILAYTFLTIGWQTAIILSEHIDKARKRPFSIISIIIIIFMIITVITKNRDLAFVALAFGIPLGIAFISDYTKRLYILADRSMGVRKQILTFFISILTIIIGYLLIGDVFILRFGIWIRVIGDIFVIIGVHYFKWALDHLPDFGEFEWHHSITSLLVVHSNGIPIFSRFWNPENKIDQSTLVDKDLMISGAMNTVDILLNEIMGKERLNRIQLENKVVYFEKSKDFMVIVFAMKDLESLAIRVREFTENFEELFGTLLPDWTGNTQLFMPSEGLADKHFIPRSNSKC